MKNVILTPADRVVLQSYIPIVDGLAAYLGDGYEIVLYSLEDIQRSVLRIANGHYTGRVEGAPMNNLAVSIAEHYQNFGSQEYFYYSTNDESGRQLRFISIAIKGEGRKIIGLLSINSYMHIQQQDVLSKFFDKPEVLISLAATTVATKLAGGGELSAAGMNAAAPVAPVSGGQDLPALMAQAKAQVDADGSILPSLKNREIIQLLENQGVFDLKNAVLQVAEFLGISKNTVYMHLRSIRK